MMIDAHGEGNKHTALLLVLLICYCHYWRKDNCYL